MKEIPSTAFTWNSIDRRFVGDKSTIGEFTKIYPACQFGITIVSVRTGEDSCWVVRETSKIGNRILAWILTPTVETLRRLPSLKNVQTIILNT